MGLVEINKHVWSCDSVACDLTQTIEAKPGDTHPKLPEPGFWHWIELYAQGVAADIKPNQRARRYLLCTECRNKLEHGLGALVLESNGH